MNEGSAVRGVSVLAEPTRAAILRLMLAAEDGRLLVGRTADVLGLRQPTVSHHMRALLDEGIVTREPAGRQTWYSIAPDQRDRIGALFATQGAADRRDVDLGRIASDLGIRLSGAVDRSTIERVVAESFDLLAGSSHPTMIGSRTAAFAAARLEGTARRARAGDVPTVLFVCVQNAGRSQIAAGILRHLGGERVRVRTAGSSPAGDVRATIMTTLDEIGVPLGGEFPKPLTDDAVRAADFVVTMGCGDVCAIYAGTTYLDWDVEDPVGRPQQRVNEIRDDIDRRVRLLMRDILDMGTPAVHRPLSHRA